MRIVRGIGCAVVILLSAFPIYAQQTHTKPWYDISRLMLGTDSLQIYLVREDGRQHLGTLWDEVVLDQWNGVRAVRRTYRTTNRLFGNHHEVTYTRFPDLQPLADRTEAALYSSHTIYRTDSIVGWSQPRDSARREYSLPAVPGQFDAQSVDLLVRTGDLGPGFDRQFTAFLSTSGEPGRMRAWVTGSAVLLDDRGTPRAVWVVELDFNGLGNTMWIDKQTRALHQQVIRLAPGMEIHSVRSRPGA